MAGKRWTRREFIASGVAAASAFPLFQQAQKVIRLGRPQKKIKTVISLFMVGGPSQMELFDYKPALIAKDGLTAGGFADELGSVSGIIMKPISRFQQFGSAGHYASDLVPNISKILDELTFVRSVNCSSNNHSLAQLEYNTGTTQQGNPFAGAWLNSLLENRNPRLPGSVVMHDELGTPRTAPAFWDSGSLPKEDSRIVLSKMKDFHRGLKEKNFANPAAFASYLSQFESVQRGRSPASDLLLDRRLANLRLAFEMREALLGASNLEFSAEEIALYGLQDPSARGFGEQLLMARRLAEEEVPFVQVCCGNEEDKTSWDNHTHLEQIKTVAGKMDRPVYGLIMDLKNRGLLDQTLILWGGEFGRLPVIQADSKDHPGRGHNEKASTIWLAGGGLKRGFSFGATDELSMRTVENRVEMGDVWATIFHLMGLDHRQAKFNDKGFERRFTRAHHRVLHEILA